VPGGRRQARWIQQCTKTGAKVEAAVRARLAAGEGVKKVAKRIGVGNGTVSRIKAEMAA